MLVVFANARMSSAAVKLLPMLIVADCSNTTSSIVGSATIARSG